MDHGHTRLDGWLEGKEAQHPASPPGTRWPLIPSSSVSTTGWSRRSLLLLDLPAHVMSFLRIHSHVRVDHGPLAARRDQAREFRKRPSLQRVRCLRSPDGHVFLPECAKESARPSRTHAHTAFPDSAGTFDSDIQHPTSKCPFFFFLSSNRRLICRGYCDSHPSPCLTSQVEEMGNPFKKLVLKFSDSLAGAPPRTSLPPLPPRVPPKAVKSTTRTRGGGGNKIAF